MNLCKLKLFQTFSNWLVCTFWYLLEAHEHIKYGHWFTYKYIHTFFVQLRLPYTQIYYTLTVLNFYCRMMVAFYITSKDDSTCRTVRGSTFNGYSIHSSMFTDKKYLVLHRNKKMTEVFFMLIGCICSKDFAVSKLILQPNRSCFVEKNYNNFQELGIAFHAWDFAVTINSAAQLSVLT